MRRLLRFSALILLAPSFYSFGREAYQFLISDVDLEHVKWFLLGFFLYVLISPFIAGERIEVFEHFEHELAHAVVGFIFLRGTRKFIVNPKPRPVDSTMEEGSKVEFDTPGTPNWLILLSPYYLPTFTVPLLIAEPVAFYPIHEVIDFLIGFTLAFHYISLLRSFGLRQTDITRVGVMFSFAVTGILNIVILVMVLCIVSSEYTKILRYFENALLRTLESYKTIYQTLRMLNEITSTEASSFGQIAA